MGNIRPIPVGFRTVTPALIVKGAAEAIEFYKKAFRATEVRRHEMGGHIGHAEIKIGDSLIMLSDEFPQMGAVGPRSIGGTPVSLYLYVEDVDAVFRQAMAAGAKAVMPVEDMFWGDRYGLLEDPFGHRWSVATHKKDLSEEEIGKRAAAAFGQK